jgi:type I restriction enzyme S subunit
VTEFGSIAVRPFTAPAGWSCRRVDSVLLPVRRTVSPEWFAGREVFHYSIPVIEETGDGRLENGSHIDSAKLLLHGGEVLISKLNPRKGRVLVAVPKPHPIVASGEFIVLQPNGVEGNFARYLLSSEGVRQFLSSAVHSVTKSQQRVEPAILTKAWVVIPALGEQHAIADFLDRETCRIDELSGMQRRFDELLTESRKAIVAKTVCRGVAPKGRFKDSGIEWLGEIPTHWRLVPVKRLFRLIVDPAPDDNGMELLSLYTDIGVRPRKELEARGNKASTTDGYFKVRRGDFIINKLLAWMGAIGLSEYEGVTSPAYDILRPIAPMVNRYFDYLFRCGICLPEFRRHSRGIMDMRLRLYFDKLGPLLMPCPPVDEQAEIVEFLDGETSKIDAIRAAVAKCLENLHEYRSALISAAVTGQINVRNYRPQEVAVLCQ